MYKTGVILKLSLNIYTHADFFYSIDDILKAKSGSEGPNAILVSETDTKIWHFQIYSYKSLIFL